MIESLHKYTVTDEKIIEKVIMNEDLNYIHVVLPSGERFPVHYSNAKVLITVVRGVLSIGLEGQDFAHYEAGTIVEVPYQTKMDLGNDNRNPLEIFIIKAPGPEKYH